MISAVGERAHRQLAGKFVSLDPVVFNNAIGRPNIVRLSRAVKRYSAHSLEGPMHSLATRHNSHTYYLTIALGSLVQAVRDTSFMTYAALSLPDASLHDTARARSPKFLDAIADLARLPHKEFGTYYQVQGKHIQDGISASQFFRDAYELTQTMHVDDRHSVKGCPFAAIASECKKRDPLFDNFVSWSASLAIVAYYTHPPVDPKIAVPGFMLALDIDNAD